MKFSGEVRESPAALTRPFPPPPLPVNGQICSYKERQLQAV